MRRRAHDAKSAIVDVVEPSIECVDGDGFERSNRDATFFGRGVKFRAVVAMIALSSGAATIFLAFGFHNGSTSGGGGATSNVGVVEHIPRRLIFTYKYNLLEPVEGDPPFDATDPLTANVLRTIDVYRSYWAASDKIQATLKQSTSQSAGVDADDVGGNSTVTFLSDKDCRRVINETEPRLLPHFDAERRGEFKADICRCAELYLNGGLYFDIDIGVVNPLDLENARPAPPEISTLPSSRRDAFNYREGDGIASRIITFSSVQNMAGRFFQAFMAAMPGHPVVRDSLNFMVHYYEGTLGEVLPRHILEELSRRGADKTIPSRNNTAGMGVGPLTLNLAFKTTTEEEWEDFALRGRPESEMALGSDSRGRYKYSRILKEVSLEDENVVASGIWKNVPLQDKGFEKKNKFCNFVCYDNKIIYFYSRVLGSKGCPLLNK